MFINFSVAEAIKKLTPQEIKTKKVVVETNCDDPAYILATQNHILSHLGGEYYVCEVEVADTFNFNIISGYPEKIT